ncbi:unnamed protein product [Blepharisma stoltei]|uniref:UBA domain-containing protein n=1 Tax=Blepharisma stoltei TaxID=1481888 RepID=A0AAU9K361_9CILI|nr:unnamed protein product [Blepharisma stoltei]
MDIELLEDLGFGEDEAREALKLTQGDFEQAFELLSVKGAQGEENIDENWEQELLLRIGRLQGEVLGNDEIITIKPEEIPKEWMLS